MSTLVNASPLVKEEIKRGAKPPVELSARLSLIVRYAILVIISLIFLTPFALALTGSFKTSAEIEKYPPQFLPAIPQWENWQRVFRDGALTTASPDDAASQGNCKGGWLSGAFGSYCFPYWLSNSVFLAVLRVLTQVFFSALAGYAFARMEFPGKNIVFAFMLATMMIPGAVRLIPGYVLITKIGWINTYWSLIVPSLVEPFGIFLMTQFFKAIPKEIEEAAFMDGADRFFIFWRVVMPLARPALITLAILSFQGSWNDFLTPLLYLNKPIAYTLPVGLAYFKSTYNTLWNFILVGSMFNTIPVLIIFFIFNRYFIEGVAYTGVKG
jgi:multiple sugar transport system permease protein